MFSHGYLLHVIANQSADWCGNPFPFGRAAGSRPYGKNIHPPRRGRRPGAPCSTPQYVISTERSERRDLKRTNTAGLRFLDSGFASARNDRTGRATARVAPTMRTYVLQLSGEHPRRGPQTLPWPFQIGRVKGGEEYGIFPSLVSFLFHLFFGQAKKR